MQVWLLSSPSITNCSIAGFPGVVAANGTTETGSTKTFDATFYEFCDSFLIHSLLRIMNEPSFPGDQCRRTVSDRWFCQHVGDIPGFHWLCFPWGSGNLEWFLLEELLLSSASKHLILSPQPQSPSLYCLYYRWHKACGRYTFRELCWDNRSLLNQSILKAWGMETRTLL